MTTSPFSKIADWTLQNERQTIGLLVRPTREQKWTEQHDIRQLCFSRNASRCYELVDVKSNSVNLLNNPESRDHTRPLSGRQKYVGLTALGKIIKTLTDSAAVAHVDAGQRFGALYLVMFHSL